MDLASVRKARPRDYAIRFAFGAVISVVAALITKGAGARLGGAFLAFPAILPASLTLIQEKDGSRDADRDAVGSVLGGVALVIFAAVAQEIFGKIPAPAVLACCLAAWLAGAFLLYWFLAAVHPDACDKNQD
ncbi:MAG: hypothetical protein M0Z30_02935 [Actinomycetota bacterium]|nr:hypothetical protein [Actinomycetota bacterium]